MDTVGAFLDLLGARLKEKLQWSQQAHTWEARLMVEAEIAELVWVQKALIRAQGGNNGTKAHKQMVEESKGQVYRDLDK